MSFTKQTLALTGSGLRGIAQRRGSSLVTVIGVTSVVGVLLSLLSMREGTATLQGGSAERDHVVLLGSGAATPADSVISREAVVSLADAPGLRRTSQGEPYLAASSLVAVDAIRRNGKRGGVMLVGVTKQAALVQPDIRIIEGRLYRPAVHEVIVPDAIRRIFRGMDVGKRITLRGVEWTIVGAFSSGDSVADSLLRADAETVLSAFGRNTFQEVNARLESPASLQPFKDWVTRNPALAVDIRTLAQTREERFSSLNRLLTFIAWSIGGVMGAGAVCGALNSLYASVETRKREIATLRAIGFNNGPIVISLLVEGMLLAVPGALLGSLIAWLLFNGDAVSTNGVVLRLTVTPKALFLSVSWALGIGLLGASLPALRAARMPVASALRTI
jgi:putative ABC transport system permease protein